MLNDKSMLRRNIVYCCITTGNTNTHAQRHTQISEQTHNKPGFQRADLFVVVVHAVVEKANDCSLGYEDKTHTHTHIGTSSDILGEFTNL